MPSADGKVYRKRSNELATPNVYLVSPHGTVIFVSAPRAEQLLSRADYDLPGGDRAGYRKATAEEAKKLKVPANLLED